MIMNPQLYEISTQKTPNRSDKHSCRGFSLIELLVVITVIGILAVIIIPILQGVRNTMSRTADVANVRQIGIAINTYAADSGGFLPGPTWSGQTATYYYHAPVWRSWNLVEYLAPYLGLPDPDGTVRVGDSFVSPAYLASPQGISTENVPYMTNYILNNQTPGLTQLPFGVPPRDGIVVKPMRLAVIPDPEKTWAMISADQQISSVSSYTNLSTMPEEPYNNGYRTVLYFDGRVESLATNTEIPRIYP